MSIYSLYEKCVASFINSDKSLWDFKSNPDYTQMLEHLNKTQGDEYLEEIKNKFSDFFLKNKNYLIELSNTNDFCGKTIKFTFEDFATCSPSNLRYIYHSLLILKQMKEYGLSYIDVIEIGGGYGGLCFFVNKLSIYFNIKINSYNMFDLPNPLLLQEKYLKDLGIDNLSFYNLSDNNFKNVKQNSFLISAYAFSEVSLEIQKEYTKKVLNPYVMYGFLAWNAIDLYDFIDNKDVTSEKEKPLTGPNNLYVRFKPYN